MTNLTRVTGKVFGGSAPLDEIGQFGSAKAGTKLNTQDVATIQALPAYSSGWGSAIMTSRNFPPIEEVTGVLKTISYQNCYLLQEGVPTYDINTNYSDTSIVKVINGTNISFYLSLTNDNIGNPLSDATHWVKASFADRAIGEIVTSSIPLSDAGLHPLNGAKLEYGIYKDFIDYIASIYNSSLNYFCTESEWQTSVDTYGVCGKFVYDSVNNTVRLPNITGFTEGGTEATLGDLVEAGLPNITGRMGNTDIHSSSSTGCFYRNGTSGQLQNDGGEKDPNVYFDASRSNPIYGNSTTVQPQTIKVLYYIVVATTTKTDVEVDIDNIATELNTCLDTKRYDGQWVINQVTLSTSTALGTYTLDLSSILPNDGYSYEILLYSYLSRGSSGAGTNTVYDILNSEQTIRWTRLEADQTNFQQSNESFIAIVGSERSIKLSIGSAQADSANTDLLAYRRIGTNS